MTERYLVDLGVKGKVLGRCYKKREIDIAPIGGTYNVGKRIRTFAGRRVCPDPDTFCPSAFVRIRTLRMACVRSVRIGFFLVSGSGYDVCPDPEY